MCSGYTAGVTVLGGEGVTGAQHVGFWRMLSGSLLVCGGGEGRCASEKETAPLHCASGEEQRG